MTCDVATSITAFHYGPGDGGINAAFETLNPGFEAPVIAPTWSPRNENTVPGWNTDDPSNLIEIWRNPNPDGVANYAGVQAAELNYVVDSRLWQELVDLPSVEMVIEWEWAHRARRNTGANRAQMLLGDATTPFAGHDIVSDSNRPANSPWMFLNGTWTKPAGITSIVVSLQAITPTGGVGNIVDAVRLSTTRRTAILLTDCAGGRGRWVDSITGEEVPAEQIELRNP